MTGPFTDHQIDLYRRMVLIRAVEEGIADVYDQWEVRCPVHLCIGQEAVAAGACAALGENDTVYSNHRSHGHYLAKGGDLAAMLAEIHGKSVGCAGGYGGSMHLIDRGAGFAGATPIVGSSISIAAGHAFADRARGRDAVTMVFFGDGATEAGVFYETLSFACLHRLPIVFVCENNLYSVYSPMEVRQPASRSLGRIAKGLGVPASHGDGNDVEIVYDLCKKAVDRARSSQGPSFVELDTYRWREHCGPLYDNDIGYRTEQEFETWRDSCPIKAFAARLSDDFGVDPGRLTDIRLEAESAFADALATARQAEFPLLDERADHFGGMQS